MIWKSVIGEVRSSSIVPERFSSAYVRMVMSGSTKSRTTVAFSNNGRISIWLMLTGPPPPNCPICMLCCRKKFRIAT